MLKKLGVLTMMLVGTVAFLQPVAAQAQSPYDRGYYSYYGYGDRDRHYSPRRDFERREWVEREARERKWREHERREHERWERRNGYDNRYYNYYNPYNRYPY